MMRAALMALVRGYQLLFGSWIGPSCRFEPTCSAYAMESLQRHGAAAGTYLAVARLARCHPWCAGGHDPVPQQLAAPRLFSRLVTPLSKKKSS
jgi:putative membrane protein insertion efficiency factor